MAAPQAKFEFVATGDAAVNAQIESVVNKLVKMKMQARDTTESTAEGMEKARISTHLLNEELGLGIPRAMQHVMAMTPGLNKALSMAFTITAAVGFVEIIDKLVEKMPELTDAIMGFGEKAKEAFEKLKSTNEAIFKALEANKAQAQADTLLGLSGSNMDAAILAQLKEKLAKAKDDQAKEAAKVGEKETIVLGAGRTREFVSPEHVEKVNQKVAELKVTITQLEGAIESVGKHLSHDIGDEGAAAADKAAQATQKAREAVNKMLGGMDQANRDPIEQAIATENQGETAKLSILKDALDKKVITILQYNIRERQIVSEHMSALLKITTDGWDKIVNGFGANTQPGGIPDILFAGLDPFAGLKKQFADAQQQIERGLELEAAKEKEVSDQAKATGESQYTTEQKLLDIRTHSAASLQTIADKMKEIAQTMGGGTGGTMTADAAKFEAKLQDLRVKTASWGTELKKSLTQDGQNLFVGLASGAEGWAQAFQNAGQSILAELAKIVYQLYIVKLLQAAIGGLGNMFGGGGSGGGGQIFDSSFFPNVTPHAMGGPVMPGQTYLVGERGPELMRFGGSGYITPNSQMGGAPPVQVNIHNYGQPMEQQQTSHFDGQQYVVDVVIKDIQSNGPIRQALR